MTRRLALLLVLYLAVAAVIGVGLVDDAYIFLRYGRHVAMGLGPVFNVGERVEGYTSPLWLAIVSSLFALKSDPAALALYASAGIGAATVVLVNRRSFLGALALAINPGFVFWAFSGMDTALTGFCLAASGLALTVPVWSKRAPLACGAAFSAACLCRLDCLVLLPALVGWIVHRSRSERTFSVASAVTRFVAPLAAVLAHFAWRWMYYGALVPNTAVAKAGVGLPSLLTQGLAYLPDLVLLAGPMLIIVWLSASRQAVRSLGLCLTWFVFVVVIGGDHFPFVRFGVPLVPLLGVLAGESPKPARQRVAALMIAAQFLLLVVENRARGRAEVFMASAWAETGRRLNEIVPPDGTIATLVAGAIPYYADRRTVDLLGLTDAHIARQGHVADAARVGHQRYDSDYVLRQQPSVVVLHDSGRYGQPRFLSDGWPHYSDGELRYVFALQDLVQREDTRRLYVYRPEPLASGHYLEVLWRR